MTPDPRPRVFVGSSTGIELVQASYELDAAMDILGDARMLDEKRMKLLVTAERMGQNPEHLARKLVTLNASLRHPEAH